MKIIFLDIDGVLNSHEWIHANQHLFNAGRLFMHQNVDRTAVARVQQICDATGAKIVISSTWRRLNTLEQLQNVLRNHGLASEVIGTTPILSDFRGKEIQQWLDNNGPIESFVIIDDDGDMLHLMDRLVKTSFDTGLQDRHVSQAIETLNAQTN